MKKQEVKSVQAFEKIWGEAVLSGGFSQLPNDLIRGVDELKLNVYDLAVLEYIISVGAGYASARSIADAQGISIGTVRKSFKKFRKLNYVRFYIAEEGQPNKFDLRGLVRAVREVAWNRQRASYQKSRAVVVLGNTPAPEADSNKDVLNTNEEKRSGFGYKNFEELRKAQKEKTKPP